MDNKAKDVAMQMAEDARQAEWEAVSFTAEVFKGSFAGTSCIPSRYSRPRTGRSATSTS